MARGRQRRPYGTPTTVRYDPWRGRADADARRWASTPTTFTGEQHARGRQGGATVDARGVPSPRPCAVAGIGTTEYSRNSGRSVLSLATEASLGGAGRRWPDRRRRRRHRPVRPRHRPAQRPRAQPGAQAPRLFQRRRAGRRRPCGMVGQAVAAILSGQATTVLVFRSLNGRSGPALRPSAR